MEFSRACVIPLVIALFASHSPWEIAVAEDYFHRTFEWNYRGIHWTWKTSVPESSYNSYRKVPISDRLREGTIDYDYLVSTQDSYVKKVANMLHEAAAKKGYEAYDEVSFILAFVQSLPYTSDSVTTRYDEYPRFPVETLVDGGGDCEDTSILFATIVLILDYGAVFISPPEHVAVGVLGKDLSGYYWTYRSRTYYYCETTGENWRIGDLPDEYENASARLFAIDDSRQYKPGQDFSDSDNDSVSFARPDLVWPTILITIALSAIIIGIAGKKTKTEAAREPETP